MPDLRHGLCGHDLQGPGKTLGTNPRVVGELDRFFAAASQRLGEEGERAASRAASSGRRMELPGIGREHQAGLDNLARHFVQAREGVTFNARWEHRIEQQAN